MTGEHFPRRMASRLLVCADESASTREHRSARSQAPQSLAGANHGHRDSDCYSRHPAGDFHAEGETRTRPAGPGARHPGWNRRRVRYQFFGAAGRTADADRNARPCARIEHTRTHTGADSGTDADIAPQPAANTGAKSATGSTVGAAARTPACTAATPFTGTRPAGNARSTTRALSAASGSSGARANTSAEACCRCSAVSRSRSGKIGRNRACTPAGHRWGHIGHSAETFGSQWTHRTGANHIPGSAPRDQFLAGRGNDPQASAATCTCSKPAAGATGTRAGTADWPRVRGMPDVPRLRGHRMPLPRGDAHAGRPADAPGGGRIAAE